ncbi:Na-translocating system protein MpsC family protein [Litchfieldia salsa]|uniref:Uncharacterized protein YbcI n=1 Tax=Litchfieldia salsa TaxID=930152 RepID=A0A1H0WKL7_9BACI|nr:Na-translocating system protein MpsC family protein [Litchfieldia salsa]SDP91260.1 Uncharacterized protein YbcI [Litchfieldia salsa]
MSRNIDNIIDQHEELTMISSYTSKLIKKTFGKGPESCFSQLSDQYIVIYIKKFMTPIEEVLVSKGKLTLAESIRNTVMKEIYLSLTDTLHNTLGKKVYKFYTDWDYINNIGVIWGEWEESTPSNKELPIAKSLKSQVLLYGQELFQEITDLSIERIGHTVYLAKCNVDLLPIEKVLLEKGLVELLKENEREVRHFYSSRKKSLEKVFNREIEAIFMCWDYSMNSFYILFILKS